MKAAILFLALTLASTAIADVSLDQTATKLSQFSDAWIEHSKQQTAPADALAALRASVPQDDALKASPVAAATIIRALDLLAAAATTRTRLNESIDKLDTAKKPTLYSGSTAQWRAEESKRIDSRWNAALHETTRGISGQVAILRRIAATDAGRRVQLADDSTIFTSMTAALQSLDAAKEKSKLLADAEELNLYIQSIGSSGMIIAGKLSYRSIPGSTGRVGAGGLIQYPQELHPTGEYLVLLDYKKLDNLAEGDKLTVRAYRDGVSKFTDALGSSRTLPAWRTVE